MGRLTNRVTCFYSFIHRFRQP